MDAALTLHLSAAQATQLTGFCAAYRTYAWRALPPTPERNQMMKALQAVQGRLAQALPEGAEQLRLTACEEEKQALRQMVRVLMDVARFEAPSEERIRKLGELAGVRLLIERTCRPTQTL